MNANPKFLSATAHVDEAAVKALPNSRKVYVEGSRPDIRVPMREIAQAGAVAEVQKTQSETALNQAKAQSEAIKPEVEAVRAFQTGHQLGMPPQGGSGDFPPS